MDDFERAILYAFDQSGAVSAEIRKQATDFLVRARTEPTIWPQVFLDHFRLSDYGEVQFWCLQSIEDWVRSGYAQADRPLREAIRFVLFSIACGGDGTEGPLGAGGGAGGDPSVGGQQPGRAASGGGLLSNPATAASAVASTNAAVGTGFDSSAALKPRPVFVRNKLAQIIAQFIFLEYPANWPSVFLDLISSLSRGPVVADMFCRVLITLDEELISIDYPRSAEESAASMRVKDAIRGMCVQQMVDAWYALIVAYRATLPELVASVLEVVQRYVVWIDIILVANERFMPIIFGMLCSPEETARLRGAAASVLLAIVMKRMDAASKVALLKRLEVVEICSSLTDVKDAEFALKVSGLFTGIANEVLECLKKMESGECSAGGDDVAVVGALAGSMLDRVMPAVLFFMGNRDEEVSATTFQFLSAYVSRIKRRCSGGGHVADLTIKEREHLDQILSVVRNRMRYDDDVFMSLDEVNERGAAMAATAAAAAGGGGSLPPTLEDEEEQRMEEYRRDLYTIFRNIAKISPDVTREFVQSTLSSVLGKSNEMVPSADVEVSLTLLYLLGEGAGEDVLKPGSGSMGDIFAALLSAKVPWHGHRIIALSYLEIIVRFVKFLQQQPQCIPAALTAFLDERGVRHPNPNVSSRASYLFMRLVKVLRTQLKVYLDTILQSLQGILGTITSFECISSKKDPSVMDERLYLFEAVGLLIGTDDLPADKQLKYLAAIVGPLCEQAKNILVNQTSADDNVGSPQTAGALMHFIHALGSISKGFGEQLAGGAKQDVSAVLKQALGEVLGILQRLPRNKALRSKVISFLHRMVECLGSGISPVLPIAIQQLLVDCESRDLFEFIQLMNQLVNKFKGAMMGILNEVVRIVLGRVFEFLSEGITSDGLAANTEEVRERRELQRIYFTFLQSITANDLSSVFITPQNSGCLNDVVSSLLQGACDHAEVPVRKICVQALIRLASEWCEQPEKVPGFRRFIIEKFVTECCLYSTLRNTFDLRDANTVSLLGEIAVALKTVYLKCGDEFLVHMRSVALPTVHCPDNMADEYCQRLQNSDTRELRSVLKTVIEKLRPLQNGSYG
ncbi:hypothetical protein CBR_g44922 [Chara braunii]|uniref:Exportin-T n=1 Tax=Chara braunii TaxID=69332 RepID=A0A388LXZ7_CHABU|nr:hypothetical protein CBR_g44922 [Chara braunii]|eukprot:GBG87187.1 hypothetical protein CBR_g44922 [Chara braunii]